MTFTMYITDENLVTAKTKYKMHYAIFGDSNGVEYIRLNGNLFTHISKLGGNFTREKTAVRGETHIYPHRDQDLPKQ